jgi:NAD-dependent DNA ligase (contains BRCT domain type II)
MSFEQINPGKNIPEEINVIIEIPTQGDPVKYEVDKQTGAMHVDRFMSTAMYYPCNYGYVPRDAKCIQFPSHCPICDADVLKQPGEAAVRCSGGLFCPAQRKQAILHFVSRKAMNIQGLGDKLIDQLVDRGLITHVADIYRLTRHQLMGLDRLAEKSADNILMAIKQSLATTLPKFIYALGIRDVGEATARQLAQFFGDLEPLIAAECDVLQTIAEIGPIVAKHIETFFSANP